MTKDKVSEVVTKIRAALPTVSAPQRHETMVISANINELRYMRAVEHLHHVCITIPTLLEQNRIEKAMRRLGFLQGAVWCLGLYSVNELGNMNKPTEAA